MRVARSSVSTDGSAPGAWIQRFIVVDDDDDTVTAALTVLGRASASADAVIRPSVRQLLGPELALFGERLEE